jgi:hypothetical protein
MENTLLRMFFATFAILMVACGRREAISGAETGESVLSQADIQAFNAATAAQRRLIASVRKLEKAAEGGDANAAREWRILTKEVPIRDADLILDGVKKWPKEEIARMTNLRKTLSGIREEMHTIGWYSLRPVWISAKLGDPEAQNELFDFFSNRRYQRSNFVLIDGRQPYLNNLVPPAKHDARRPKVDVLLESARLGTYAHMVDDWWTPDAYRQRSLYVEGRYRCEGVEFSPRDWLAKAAVTNSKYKAKLAAVDFLSAKNEEGRNLAAKILISEYREEPESKDVALQQACMAAIYYRGISVPTDRLKAAVIMLSSSDGSLRARGIRLACQEGMPLDQYLYDGSRENSGLINAICSKNGYGPWRRDFERAYFEYWLFLAVVEDSRGGDASFARKELAELENRLTGEAVISLQNRCWIWAKKFDWKSPNGDQWLAR